MTQSTRVGSPGSQFNGLGWEHGGEGGMVLKRMIQLGTAAALHILQGKRTVTVDS